MAETHAQHIPGYHPSYLDTCLERWQRVLDESRSGLYTPQRLFSDVFRYWAEVVSFFALPWGMVGPYTLTPRFSSPTVFINLDPTQDEIVQVVPIPDPGPIEPVAESLVQPGTSTPRIPVKAFLSTDRRFLILQIQNLNALHPIPGEYQGHIAPKTDRTRLIAQIIAHRP
jgi:hypothetical protein